MIAPFQCNKWICGANTQTIWPKYFRKVPDLELLNQRLWLPDGDFLDLRYIKSEQKKNAGKGIVVIVHGLGGCINSHYSKSLMYAMWINDLIPVFVHLRGASEEVNKKSFSYHAGKTDDIACVIDKIHSDNPGQKIFAIGISLGGGILLNYLGRENTINPLTSAVAVSVPYDLYETTMTLNKGFAKNYQRYILKGLTESLRKKFENRVCPIDLKIALNAKTILEYDDAVTAPLNGFKGVMDYYKQCSSKQYLKNIKTPTLLIHAKDDPFMTEKSIPEASDLNEIVKLELYEKGGHVGFVEGHRPWDATYYLDRRIPDYFLSFG